MNNVWHFVPYNLLYRQRLLHSIREIVRRETILAVHGARPFSMIWDGYPMLVI